MDDPPVQAAVASGWHEEWREGQAVAITSGVLAGLTGALVRCDGEVTWLLTLDCLQRGVLLRIEGRALRQLTESTAEGSPATCPAPPQATDRHT